jgi:RND family efflux transporter MFP subunit
MNKIVKYIIILALLAVAGMVFYKKVYVPKTTFETILPTVGALNVKVFGIGNVSAKDIYSINAQTGGKILSILTDEGEWVKKGDLLVTIDSVDIPQLLEEAKIAVQKANSELEATKKELQSLNVQKDLLYLTYKRYSKLKKQAFVSQAEYDKAKAEFDAIKAQIEATKAHINSAKTEINRAKKGVEALETKLSRYNIFAPVDGYVISKDAQESQTVGSSQPILKIVDSKTVWIKAYIDEKLSGNIKVGQKATISLRSQGEKKFDGVVKRIVAQSDAITQEREVNVAFDKLPIPFYINEQAEVNIFAKSYKDIVKIPARAVTYEDGKVGIWINRDQKAHFQTIDIVARSTKELGVSGIDKDTKIIIASKKNKPLKEGMSIH